MNTISKRIIANDSELSKELTGLIKSGKNLPLAIKNNTSVSTLKKAMIGPVSEMPRSEAMIQMFLRPSLFIKNNKIEAPDSVELRNRFLPFVKKIEKCVPSVGRIEFSYTNNKFAGTGWLIAPNIIVTNRHVAMTFAEFGKKEIVFRSDGLGNHIGVVVDFKEEYIGKNIATKEFEVGVEKVLYMTKPSKIMPDIAFLKLTANNHLSDPINLTDKEVKGKQFISVIGYPAYDPNGIIGDLEAHKMFKDIYQVKRCSIGEVLDVNKSDFYFTHDCTTLGGNSGSVILDNETGLAVGLHYAGTVNTANYAVKSSILFKHLKILGSNIIQKPRSSQNKDNSVNEFTEEIPMDNLSDRKGYDPKFLGVNNSIPIPKVRSLKNVLNYKIGGKSVSELKYEHFSVVMNKERRQCYFSICNIDGKESKRGIARTPWKLDPRIPVKNQIIKECYGNPPKFSRGHMTRREDPVWGSLTSARLANSDTFYVPNATPQIQPFNAPVWLELENYALENARQDEMKISVITGPIFSKNDPIKYEVRIPIEFFKVIVFIHDRTKKLCATGYTVSQLEFIPDQEIVFGQFNEYQVSIKSIQARTGINFGKITELDLFIETEGLRNPLMSLNDVNFI